MSLETFFTEVYENKSWGDNGNTLYSGSSGGGSSLEFNRPHYIPFLRNFIQQNSIKSVCDLGCGDWKCGEAIYGDLNIKYTGYDTYKKIIDANRILYPKFSFVHLDFQSKVDSIESADLFILKDVLQHWHMNEIYEFLDKLVESKKCKFILICNCCNQVEDNPDNKGRSTPLSVNFFPLKKYNPMVLMKYNTKEVSVVRL